MRTLTCVTLILLVASTVSAQPSGLPEFGDGWCVAPSPDPERIAVECGESLRFHGLLDHYTTIIVPYGDVIDEQEKAALDAHADKLVIESPQIYAKTVLNR